MKIEKNKPHSIHLRLNEEQFAFLQNLSIQSDISVSDVCRMIINTTMVSCKKVENVISSKIDELNAKLGEPHADSQSNI